jgi:hypothetical protein
VKKERKRFCAGPREEGSGEIVFTIRSLASSLESRISPSEYRLSLEPRIRISLNFHNVLPVTHRKKLFEVRGRKTTHQREPERLLNSAFPAFFTFARLSGSVEEFHA